MKVLITAPSLDPSENVSGISSIVNNIINKKSAIQYEHFKLGRSDSQKQNILWLASQLLIPLKLAKALVSKKIDILHLNTPLDGKGVLRDYFISTVSKLLGTNTVLHLHGGKYLTEKPTSMLINTIIKALINQSKTIIVLSQPEKTFILTHFPPQTKKITVLPNFVETPKTKIKPIPKICRIIFLGRIVPSKGTEEIKLALTSLSKERSDFSFYLYGAGSEAGSIESELHPLMGDRFKYMGIVSGVEKQKALSEADIFLLPSHFEGLPLSLLEAMSYGAIPIATDVGSVTTVVSDSINGFITKKFDPVDLKNKISKAIDVAKSTSGQEIRRNAAKTIAEKYNGNEYIEKLGKIYFECK